MKLKGKPLTAQELASFATITTVDVKLSIRRSHPSLKPFLDATSEIPKLE